MHIPEGFLDTKMWVGMGGISSAFVTVAVRNANKKISEKHIPLLGVMAAFVFAAQLFNCTVSSLLCNRIRYVRHGAFKDCFAGNGRYSRSYWHWGRAYYRGDTKPSFTGKTRFVTRAKNIVEHYYFYEVIKK